MALVDLATVVEPDDPESIRVFVEGRIGDEPVRFLIDTGAGSCSVPLTAATANLERVETSTSRSAAGVESGDDVVVVPELGVGPITWRDVWADRFEPGPHRMAILGMDVLGRQPCHFRWRTGLVELDGSPPDGVALHSLDTLPPGQPLIPVEIGSVAVTALWDTGASLSVVDAAFAAGHPELFEIGGDVEGWDGTGQTIVAPRALMAPCAIGGIELGPSPCAVIDLSPINAELDAPIELAVGMPLTRQADWYLDARDKRWAVGAIGQAP